MKAAGMNVWISGIIDAEGVIDAIDVSAKQIIRNMPMGWITGIIIKSVDFFFFVEFFMQYI